jgi:hypothetical protein
VFKDDGFTNFARELSQSRLSYLDISKNDLSDELSLIDLAEALKINSYLHTLDVTGIKVRKPYVVQYLEPALALNITLTEVIGKVSPGLIEDHLLTN